MAFVQLIIFELCGEEYGVDIHAINGIIKSKSYPVIKIPNTPAYIEGVINVRGRVNAIFNLKEKFKLDDSQMHQDSKIILINNLNSTVGFYVDDVTDIVKLNDHDIDRLPKNIITNNESNLRGIA